MDADGQDRREIMLTIAMLRTERDEARREVCRIYEVVTGRNSVDVAKNRGWDCFKEYGDAT